MRMRNALVVVVMFFDCFNLIHFALASYSFSICMHSCVRM